MEKKKFILITLAVSISLLLLQTSMKESWSSEPDISILPMFLHGYDISRTTPRLNSWTGYYATFAISVPNTVTVKSQQEWSYVFQSVLTTLAWKKIGFKTVVTLVFDSDSLSYHSAKILKFIVEQLISIEAKVIYIDVRSNLRLRVSQFIRLFTSHLLKLNDDDFVLLSDADLWPLNRTRFYPRVNKSILITNTGMGDLRWGKKIITFFPMSHIGMAIRTWKVMFPIQLSGNQNQKQLFIDDIQSRLKLPSLGCNGTKCNYYYFQDIEKLFIELKEMYGKEVYQPTWHGGMLWYMDQWYLSVGIYKYQQRYGREMFFSFFQRECVRVNRIHWEADLNITRCCWCDAHTLQRDVWGNKQWKRMMLLIVKVFENDSIELAVNYQKEFSKLFNQTLYIQGFL